MILGMKEIQWELQIQKEEKAEESKLIPKFKDHLAKEIIMMIVGRGTNEEAANVEILVIDIVPGREVEIVDDMIVEIEIIDIREEEDGKEGEDETVLEMEGEGMIGTTEVIEMIEMTETLELLGEIVEVGLGIPNEISLEENLLEETPLLKDNSLSRGDHHIRTMVSQKRIHFGEPHRNVMTKKLQGPHGIHPEPLVTNNLAKIALVDQKDHRKIGVRTKKLRNW